MNGVEKYMPIYCTTAYPTGTTTHTLPQGRAQSTYSVLPPRHLSFFPAIESHTFHPLQQGRQTPNCMYSLRTDPQTLIHSHADLH